jgi:hypothetical protein
MQQLAAASLTSHLLLLPERLNSLANKLSAAADSR